MWLINLAWKNIWRSRNRTIITMASIFFAVILSVLTNSLQDGIFDNLVKNIVSFYSGEIQVQRPDYWNEQILDNGFEEKETVEKKLLAGKNIAGITPRLESFALASSKYTTKGCLVAGIDPLRENKITRLQSKLIAGSYLGATDRAVLLSEGLAQQLQLGTGDTIILIGQGYHGATAAGKYLVKGILHFGSPDLNDRILFIPLTTAQDLFSAEKIITSYVLLLDRPELLSSTAVLLQSALGSQLRVMTWEEMLPDIKQHIQTDSNNMKIIQAILYLLIGLGIFGTLLMMMVERQYELGLLLAIGMKKSRLILLLLAESVISVLWACLLGILCSIPLVFYLNRHPLRMGGETA
ncbi:MAG TPA: ABC transporter permease, partial [Chitinophagaceae bacterium]|nr:ABC transporter permease [Chitinophagaceae bacterium]